MKKFKVTSSGIKVLGAINKAMSPLAKTLCGKTEENIEKDLGSVKYYVPDAYGDYFGSILTDTVASNALFKIKHDLYLEALPETEKSLHSFLLLRSLVFSDFSVSKSLLTASIEGYSEYNLDGIKNFLLKDEEEEWLAIAYATRKNSFVLKSASEFKKLIKCITSTIEGRKETFYLLDANSPCLVDAELKKVDYNFGYVDGNLDEADVLIASVVENMPQKLVIYSSAVPEKVSEALKLLF